MKVTEITSLHPLRLVKRILSLTGGFNEGGSVIGPFFPKTVA
jgi:hypothetical protein